MAVEIGSLVVRGTFGQSAAKDGVTPEELQAQLAILRRTIFDEMRDIMEEADRRARDR